MNSQDIMSERKEAAYELAGAVNTSAREGDFIVGALVDFDQVFLERSDGSGFRVSLGPVNKAELNRIKSRLGMKE